MALGIGIPTFAADAGAKASTAAHTSSGGGEGGVETAVDGALMVTRVGGVGAGVVVGTPVAIVRQTYKHYTTWTPELADKVGGHDFAPSVALVSLATVPASMIWGTVTGTFHGTRNGVTKGFTEPFNMSSFSMTKEYEE
jgi:hypothetical protein